MSDSPLTPQELSHIVEINDIASLETVFPSNADLILKGTNFSMPRWSYHELVNSKPIIPVEGLTLLHIAAFFDNFEVFHYLESKGGEFLNLRTSNGAFYLPLHYACFGSAKECAAYILARDPALAVVELECQWQAVFLATFSNSPEILELLLSHGADLRSPRNVQNRPFEQALKMNHLDCLLLLLQHSCKTDVDAFGMSPLMVAIARKAEGALEWLLDRGLDPTFVSFRGDTALALACTQGDVGTVKMLCDRMENIEIPESEDRLSSIARWAVSSKNLDILRMVLKKGCDLNRYDVSGEQPVDAIRGIIDDATGLKMLEMLIEFGYDIHSRDPKDGKAFLDRVIEFTVSKYPKIVEFLLTKGADPRVKLASGTSTLEIVKGWRESTHSRYVIGAKPRYIEIFARFFPDEFR